MDNAVSDTKKKILVVEDEPELLDLYVQILEQDGYDVDRASDGELAYKKIAANKYDLILLDIIIPKLDGLQVLETLKRASKLPIGNVVLLTNLGQDLVIAKALEYNVRGYIVKSDYTPEELLKEIHGYLENEEVKSSFLT